MSEVGLGGVGSGAQEAAWVRPLLLHWMADPLQGVGQSSAEGMDPAGVATTAVRVGENSTRRAAGARASATEHALSRAVSGPRAPTTLQLVPVLRAGHRTLHQPGPDWPEWWVQPAPGRAESTVVD